MQSKIQSAALALLLGMAAVAGPVLAADVITRTTQKDQSDMENWRWNGLDYQKPNAAQAEQATYADRAGAADRSQCLEGQGAEEYWCDEVRAPEPVDWELYNTTVQRVDINGCAGDTPFPGGCSPLYKLVAVEQYFKDTNRNTSVDSSEPKRNCMRGTWSDDPANCPYY